VGVEKVRDRNVFPAARIAAAEFFLLTSAKRLLPQWGERSLPSNMLLPNLIPLIDVTFSTPTSFYHS
jgi:hypothetical protein